VLDISLFNTAHNAALFTAGVVGSTLRSVRDDSEFVVMTDAGFEKLLRELHSITEKRQSILTSDESPGRVGALTRLSNPSERQLIAPMTRAASSYLAHRSSDRI
jgi:hypothetical protein